MRSLSEIDTTAKRASKAIGFSWGISEEIGKNVRLLEMFGLPGVKNLNQYYNIENLNIPQWISQIVIKSIIEANKVYDGSMFSEYELIGISKILQHKNIKQKIMLTLRSRLDGKLNKNQLNLSKFFNLCM